jgi:hypothetical protein
MAEIPSGRTHVLAPAIAEGIGRVITAWSWVDAALGEMLAHMMQADPGSLYVVTQSVSASTVSSWVRTLVEVRVPDTPGRQGVFDLLTELDHLRGERNAVAHGLWQMVPDTEAAICQTFKWERREVVRGEFTTGADLKDLYGRILDARVRFSRLGEAMGFLRREGAAE